MTARAYTSRVLVPRGHPLLERTLLGAVAAIGIALAARGTRALSTGGAVTAVVVGTLCVAAGWDWAVLLLVFFLTGTLWSRLGQARKETRTAGVVTKGGPRDAVQVIANGGLVAACALGSILWPSALGTIGHGDRTAAGSGASRVDAGGTTGQGGGSRDEGGGGGGVDGTAGVAWYICGMGALAAAAADTWATEVGTLGDAEPRSILTGRRVPPGTSGGVTALGSGAAVAGAGAVALAAWALGATPVLAVSGVVGGVAGATIDSLAGASLQCRRWCAGCNETTERTVHVCGARTARTGGLAWLDNDGVNAISTVAGALVTWAVARSLA